MLTNLQKDIDNMKAVEFCYWLQGYFELTTEDELELEQIETIKKHLALVFKHEIDPSYGNQAHQNDLNEIHNNGPAKPISGVMRC